MWYKLKHVHVNTCPSEKLSFVTKISAPSIIIVYVHTYQQHNNVFISLVQGSNKQRFTV